MEIYKLATFSGYQRFSLAKRKKYGSEMNHLILVYNSNEPKRQTTLDWSQDKNDKLVLCPSLNPELLPSAFFKSWILASLLGGPVWLSCLYKSHL